jgi:hypothetical protein
MITKGGVKMIWSITILPNDFEQKRIATGYLVEAENINDAINQVQKIGTVIKVVPADWED